MAVLTTYPSSSTYPTPTPMTTAAVDQGQNGGLDFLALGHRVAPYQTYTIDTYYIWNNGILQLPLAKANPLPSTQSTQGVGAVVGGAGAAAIALADLQTPNPKQYTGTQPPPAFSKRAASLMVNTSAPWGKKVVVIRARRTNAMPVLPDPTPSNPNQALLYTIIHPSTPTILPDMRSRSFSIYAEYVYALVQPLWVQDGNLTVPTTPVDGLPRSNYALQQVSFVKGLI